MSKQAEAPPTAARGGRGARQRILDAAIRLFYEEGVNATGVERLAAEASVSKRTLYQHFPSKTAVVEEYLRTIRESVGDPVHPDPTTTSGPRARILALFETPPAGGVMRGCPFHNAAVEAAGAMPEVQEIVEAHKRSYIDALGDLARQAGAADAKAVGFQLAVLYEGAASLSTSLNDVAPWTHAAKAAQKLLDDAIARRAARHR
ncbi:TetR/AcrR family transcriptional regulator [Mycolicibacterium psychrotolerans]|uniref:TetR family transcriptional regulator n=1 Tax=Mycolicibacterium psychrotolerans TaxID=216929 RepID=A0A7I7M5K7_9MYCO|nr:TetR/AcrR family transcriptional regulator [Mycolicibacterium psychrotolerans]BBX67475.1 TetR family transcriptional regulator [Mycolicibacterium psychrotolerans]